MVLAACGAVWLSVRGQHPYRGPTAADVPVLVAFIVIKFTATVAVAKRATAGVQGRTRLGWHGSLRPWSWAGWQQPV